MKEQLRKILEKAYELEGLLLLGIERDDIPETLAKQIAEKCEEISKGALEALPENNTQPNGSLPDTDEKEYELPDTDADEETISVEKEIEEEELPSGEDTLSEEDAPSNDEDEGEEETIVESEVEPEDEEDDYFYNIEDEEPEPKPRVESVSIRQKKEIPKFSINDKFLYIRELFKGNAASFYDAMDHLQNFRTADEAEKYLTERLNLDPENPTAVRFLNTVRTFY